MMASRHFVFVILFLRALLGMGRMDCQLEFERFVKKYDKKYTDEKERAIREGIFIENCEWISIENQKNLSYALGITKFTDLRSTEFHKKYYKAGKPVSHVPGSHGKHVLGAKQPDSVDWVDQGKVTDVKDQDTCDTCWTFGATATMESAVAIGGGELVSLSPQELQDCDGDHSCDGDNAGGEESDGFDYAKERGLSSLDQYKFITGNETCQNPAASTKSLQPGVVTGWKTVDATMEALMDAVAQQPVNVGINAATDGQVQNYKKGILTADCKKGDDHAVVVVGYGTENGVDYWKIKNSWGSDWGEDGYFRVERGRDQCGILDDASYPTVSVSSETITLKNIVV